MKRPPIRVLVPSCTALCILCFQPTVRPAGAVPSGYQQVWSDEFNGDSLDTSKWGHSIPGKRRGGRDANNVKEAVAVSGGYLIMTTYTADSLNGTPHYVGMIETGAGPTNTDSLVPPGNKYMPRYGYIEARIDFDGAGGQWGAFWVQTPNNTLSAPLDEHARGMEMDIVEHAVLNDSVDISAKAPSALHWRTYDSPEWPNWDFWHAGSDNDWGGTSLADSFHTYGLEWRPDSLKFYYDNALVWTVRNTTDPTPLCETDDPEDDPKVYCYAPACPGLTTASCVVAPVSHANEYIVLSSEVIHSPAGWPGGIPTGGYGSLANSTTKMKVDYVKHYKFFATPTSLTATAISYSEIDLSWADSMYDEDGFIIERSTDNANFNTVATVGADVHSYQNTGLERNTRYYYRVRAYIGTNYSSYSSTANAYTDVTPPPAVANLSVSMVGKLTLAVSWTAPGDDGTVDTPVAYDLRRSTSAITAGNFGSATQITLGTPKWGGYPECKKVTGLSSCTTYYFAIKTQDEAGNWSSISNVPNATTLCVQNILAECDLPDVDYPANVTGLAVYSIKGKLNMAVTWTAPGDVGITGTASAYDLRYSTSAITAANFNSATQVTTSSPHAAGSYECKVVSSLSACTNYYFAIKTKSSANTWSGISNVLNVTTECTQNIVAECDGGGGGVVLDVPKDEGALSFSLPSPNPARGATSFRMTVPRDARGQVFRVGVFDIAGRKVRSLVDRLASPGPEHIEWNLLDDSGQRVAPALYMVRIDVGQRRKTMPLVVLR